MAPPIVIPTERPDLNRLYVHPLFLVAGFVAHTALSVMFGVLAAPTIALAAGTTVVVLAGLWLSLSLVILVLAFIRQSQIKGSVLQDAE